jgi:type IV secretory pathway VirB2 component (pilin)
MTILTHPLFYKIKTVACIALFSLIISSFDFALAAGNQNSTTIQDYMCNAYSIFNGPLGKTFAVFAIVALGVGFFLGKVSWGTAIAVALGVGAIFGAPALVGTIIGGGDVSSCADLTTSGTTTTP